MSNKLVLAATVTLTLACTPSAVRRSDVAAIDSMTAPPVEYRIRHTTAGDAGTLTVSLRARAIGPASANIDRIDANAPA